MYMRAAKRNISGSLLRERVSVILRERTLFSLLRWLPRGVVALVKEFGLDWVRGEICEKRWLPHRVWFVDFSKEKIFICRCFVRSIVSIDT